MPWLEIYKKNEIKHGRHWAVQSPDVRVEKVLLIFFGRPKHKQSINKSESLADRLCVCAGRHFWKRKLGTSQFQRGLAKLDAIHLRSHGRIVAGKCRIDFEYRVIHCIRQPKEP